MKWYVYVMSWSNFKGVCVAHIYQNNIKSYLKYKMYKLITVIINGQEFDQTYSKYNGL